MKYAVHEWLDDDVVKVGSIIVPEDANEEDLVAALIDMEYLRNDIDVEDVTVSVCVKYQGKTVYTLEEVYG